MVLLGCVGIGLCYREQFKGRIRHMRLLQTMLSMFMSEISFGRATLPECCQMLAHSMPDPYCSCLTDIYDEMQKNRGIDFRELFATRMEIGLAKLPLEKEDVESFLWFTKHGGLQDRELQMKLLQESYDRIYGSILQQESREQSKGQLAVSLGVMSGLLLVVVLI